MKIKKLIAAFLSVCTAAVFCGGITAEAAAKPASPKIESIIYNADTKKTKISWEKTDGADGYELYYSMYPCKDYKLLADVKGSKTSYTTDKITCIDFGVLTYGDYVRIRAYKKSGDKKVYSTYSGIYKTGKKGKIKKLPVKDDSLPVAEDVMIKLSGGCPELRFRCGKHEETIAWQIVFYDKNNERLSRHIYFGGKDSNKFSFPLADVCAFSTTIKTITITAITKDDNGLYGDNSPAGETVVFKCDISVKATLQSKKLTATRVNNEENSNIKLRIDEKFNSNVPFDMMMYGNYSSNGFSTTSRADVNGTISGETDKELFENNMVREEGTLRLAVFDSAKVTAENKASIKIKIYDVTVKE